MNFRYTLNWFQFYSLQHEYHTPELCYAEESIGIL